LGSPSQLPEEVKTELMSLVLFLQLKNSQKKKKKKPVVAFLENIMLLYARFAHFQRDMSSEWH